MSWGGVGGWVTMDDDIYSTTLLWHYPPTHPFSLPTARVWGGWVGGWACCYSAFSLSLCAERGGDREGGKREKRFFTYSSPTHPPTHPPTPPLALFPVVCV